MYVGQSDRAINIRYKEHIQYIWTNNPKSAYATHILDNRHEYGTKENTLQLLQACQKGTRMDIQGGIIHTSTSSTKSIDYRATS